MKFKTKGINLVLASTRDLGIGLNNQLPWPKLSTDLGALKEITSTVPSELQTMRNSVIYGFKTFESVGKKPLPNRLNIVLSKKPSHVLDQFAHKNVKFCGSLEEAINFSENSENVYKSFVLGGATIYDQIFKDHDKFDIDTLYWTRVFKNFPTDTKLNKEYFESFLSQAKYSKVSKTIVEQGDINYDVCMFSKNSLNQALPLKLSQSEEYEYLRLMEEIIRDGEERPDRTNTGVKGLFGKMMRFDVSQSFPLLTTKSVFFRGVLEELLWFLKGETNSKLLSDKGVGIWDGNGSREFLDSRGLHGNKEGDLGPVYGFQWRHFGAEYKGMDADYKDSGVDQIQQLIEGLKTDKFSRRHLLSAWNPVDLNKMALPPCHVLSQFYVTQDNKLNCSLYQRSADIGLGIPFNIASYSLLMCLMADFLGMKRGDFVHFIGDAHIYLNHVDALKTQIQRIPNPFPVLEIVKKSDKKNIWEYEADEFLIKNYSAQAKLKMKMAV